MMLPSPCGAEIDGIAPRRRSARAASSSGEAGPGDRERVGLFLEDLEPVGVLGVGRRRGRVGGVVPRQVDARLQFVREEDAEVLRARRRATAAVRVSGSP